MRLRALMLAVFLQLFAGASAAERITDILGRSIDLAGPPQRVVLGDSLDFIFLSLLLDDPAAPIVGWAGPTASPQASFLWTAGVFPSSTA